MLLWDFYAQSQFHSLGPIPVFGVPSTRQWAFRTGLQEKPLPGKPDINPSASLITVFTGNVKTYLQYYSTIIISASANTPFGGIDDHWPFIPKRNGHPTLRSHGRKGVVLRGEIEIGPVSRLPDLLPSFLSPIFFCFWMISIYSVWNQRLYNMVVHHFVCVFFLQLSLSP